GRGCGDELRGTCGSPQDHWPPPSCICTSCPSRTSDSSNTRGCCANIRRNCARSGVATLLTPTSTSPLASPLRAARLPGATLDMLTPSTPLSPAGASLKLAPASRGSSEAPLACVLVAVSFASIVSGLPPRSRVSANVL